MAWMVTLASKMAGNEIPEEEGDEHLQFFLSFAEMLPKMIKNWGHLAQYSVLKKMQSDLRGIAVDNRKKIAEANPDKSYVYGWFKAQYFSNYIERVVGEITVKFIFSTTLR